MTTKTQASVSASPLLKAARALRMAEVLQGAVWWGVLSSGLLLALAGLDGALHLPAALRLPLAVVLSGFVAHGFYARILRPLIHPLSQARAARMLEISRGITGNVLINAHHFSHAEPDDATRRFVATVIDSSGSLLAGIKPRSLWLTIRFKKWLLGLAVLALAWVVFAVVFPRNLGTAVERIFMPLSDVPPAGRWVVEVRPAGRVALIEGDKLEISVHLRSSESPSVKPPVPAIMWKDGNETIEPSSGAGAGDRAPMQTGAKPGEYLFTFSAVTRPFSFRVWADDVCSAATVVSVSPLPKLKSAVFEVAPPTYMGVKPFTQPGPPSALSVPAGSTVGVVFETSPAASSTQWREHGATQRLENTDGRWRRSGMVVNDEHSYEIFAAPDAKTSPRLLVQGQITATPDRPPEVDFQTDDRNRLVNAGGTLPVAVKATDDYGVASISLVLTRSDDPAGARVLKTWDLLGPPGQKEPAVESQDIALDPAVFTPGAVFMLTAQATDFSPTHQRTISRPILIRVGGLKDMALPPGDALEKLFALLKTTIARQTTANGLTDNLGLHLSEALAANDVAHHAEVMSTAQQRAQEAGLAVLDEAGRRDEAQAFRSRLDALIKGEMGLALGQIAKVNAAAETAVRLDALQKRQGYILNELIALLGRIADERQEATKAKTAKTDGSTPPSMTTDRMIADLREDLKAFVEDQKKIINATKSLKALNPEDLTDAQEAMLGDLAREEAAKAAFLQEKLTDFSKLPLQDFADGKLVGEMNSVYQEVQAAASSLYDKKTEIAVPHEEAGLEKAAELEQNLEKWLPTTPDKTKWSMEEAPAQSDVPMAELPKQLEDIVGELLDKEEEMGDDVEDVSSTFMDSIDKGAGWGTGDGPISNMSAKGVTGNQLPNKNEVGGRSGEGRSGKSSGQMVGDTATGKGGRETPTRLSATPFEPGSVNDTSTDTKGGATGGGKLSGAGQEGLRGPVPPPVKQKMARLAAQQTKLRQQAEAVALELRKQRRPTGNLESAVGAMKKLEDAAKRQDGVGVVQGYHQALDALSAARSTYRGTRLSRIEAGALEGMTLKDMADAQAEAAPAGYEEMTGAYFRSLSESAAPKK